ncbi:hypothetical protein ACVBEH_22480, partial [Roseateles sp. GG27B]
ASRARGRRPRTHPQMTQMTQMDADNTQRGGNPGRCRHPAFANKRVHSSMFRNVEIFFERQRG